MTIVQCSVDPLGTKSGFGISALPDSELLSHVVRDAVISRQNVIVKATSVVVPMLRECWEIPTVNHGDYLEN